jgi:hypothetical protein
MRGEIVQVVETKVLQYLGRNIEKCFRVNCQLAKNGIERLLPEGRMQGFEKFTIMFLSRHQLIFGRAE